MVEAHTCTSSMTHFIESSIIFVQVLNSTISFIFPTQKISDMSSATAAAAPQSSTQAKQQVWLITGCSQGLGYELSKAVLAAGHKVVASSRQPTRTPEVVAEIEKLGGSWVKLDVASGEVELEVQVEKALAVYGRVDVLVNNAGVGMAGAVEDFRYVMRWRRISSLSLICTCRSSLFSSRSRVDIKAKVPFCHCCCYALESRYTSILLVTPGPYA